MFEKRESSVYGIFFIGPLTYITNILLKYVPNTSRFSSNKLLYTMVDETKENGFLLCVVKGPLLNQNRRVLIFILFYMPNRTRESNNIKENNIMKIQ